MAAIDDWDELAKICVKFNSDGDEIFDAQTIEEQRMKQFPDIRQEIERKLNRMTADGRFDGWMVLYCFALPGERTIRPLTRKDADHFREGSESSLTEAVCYFRGEFQAALSWRPSASDKISYELPHPAGWDRAKFGSVLQALVSYQRQFLPEVLPRWSTPEGGLRRHRETENDGQTIQSGRTGREALEDVGGAGLFGYDLGIDPEFE